MSHLTKFVTKFVMKDTIFIQTRTFFLCVTVSPMILICDTKKSRFLSTCLMDECACTYYESVKLFLSELLSFQAEFLFIVYTTSLSSAHHFLGLSQ